ncbi:MAG TPA: flippase [Thermomicrobiales bacterium]|nr:flippase [Thermomicrobiales bacterium]HRA31318.1 flippase [Thermomicrobiales bacterium]
MIALLANPVTIVVGVAVALAALIVGGWTIGLAPGARATANEDIVRRITRNSAVPIASQLVVRMIDLAVAIVLLRLLGPAGNGRYALAVIVWLYVKTISDFGLSLLATRDVARDPAAAGRITGATTLMRLVVLTGASLLAGGYLAIGYRSGDLAGDTVLAALLLLVSIVPSSFTEAVNSVLNGLERMTVAAWLNVTVSVARAPLVILLAASRLEVVGVAVAATIAAIASAALYARAYRLIVVTPISWRLDRRTIIELARESWPLLAGALLVNLFFRVDVFIVQSFRGDRALGLYDAAYKLINLVTIIPSYVTLAVFPALAVRSGDIVQLRRVQRLAIYLLVWLAWCIVAVVSGGADLAIRILAGRDYLPEAAILLQILILFAPLSFLNGIVQYVLIAMNEQRRIVPVFTAAVVFNLVANLLLVPRYGARAAAGVTVATELVIFLALLVATRRTAMPLRQDDLIRLWRPTVAGAVALLTGLIIASTVGSVAGAAAAAASFAVVSLGVRVLGSDELHILARAIGRARREHPADTQAIGPRQP